MTLNSSGRRPHEPSRLASRCLSILLHFAGTISCSLSFKYLIDHPTYINASYGSHWQYLTNIGLTISCGTFGSALTADITNSSTFFLLKNRLSLCSTPLEILISILYWGLCAIDPALVSPPEIYIHPLADFGLHALPSILLFLDFIYFSPPTNLSAFWSLGISSSIAVSYWIWVEHCFSHNGFYPYPLLGQLDATGRLYLFTVATLLMTGSSLILKRIYEIVNNVPKLHKPKPTTKSQ